MFILNSSSYKINYCTGSKQITFLIMEQRINICSSRQIAYLIYNYKREYTFAALDRSPPWSIEKRIDICSSRQITALILKHFVGSCYRFFQIAQLPYWLSQWRFFWFLVSYCFPSLRSLLAGSRYEVRCKSQLIIDLYRLTARYRQRIDIAFNKKELGSAFSAILT